MKLQMKTEQAKSGRDMNRAERYAEIDVGFPPRIGASSCSGTGQRSFTGARSLPSTRDADVCSVPHLLGWTRHRRLQVLSYQYGGDSESGLKPAGSPDNWRCMAVKNLSQVELLDDPWQTAENHSRPQTCIEEVELDVDGLP